MQELCWACETMTRQMQWEVCILSAAPAPPLPNKASRLSPEMFSSCSASCAQLWRPVWEGPSNLTCILRKEARRLACGHKQATANCQEVQQSLLPSAGRRWDREEGNWGVFQSAQGPGRRIPLCGVKASHKITSSKRQQGSLTLVATWQVKMMLYRCITTSCHAQHWQSIPSKDLKNTGFSSRWDGDLQGRRKETA